MRILIGALAITVLSGCASISEMRAKPPEQYFHSGKTVDALSECILFGWQNQSLAGAHYDANLQPRPGGGKSVVAQGQVEFVDVFPASDGAEIRLYVQPGTMSWRVNRRTDAIRSCL